MKINKGVSPIAKVDKIRVNEKSINDIIKNENIYEMQDEVM